MRLHPELKKRETRGNTLTETLIYVAIWSVVGGLLFGGSIALQEHMRTVQTANQFAALQAGVSYFQRDGRGDAPSSFQELQQYLPEFPVQSATEAGPNPWGNSYELRTVGTDSQFVTRVKNEQTASKIAARYGTAASIQTHATSGYEVVVPVGSHTPLKQLLSERSLAVRGTAAENAMRAPLNFSDRAIVVKNDPCDHVGTSVAVDVNGVFMSCKLRCGDRVWRPSYETAIAMTDCGGGVSVCEHQTCPSMKTCWDGSVIPVLQPCPPSQTCLDGTIVGVSDTCMRTCPDGSQVAETADCLCPDGTTLMPADGLCRCPDNSLMPSNGVCGGGPTKMCLDGTIIPVTDTCLKTCQNGSQVPETATCFCTNGLPEPTSGPCDIACPSSATTISVPYNQSCICSANNLPVANGECPPDCDPATQTWDPVTGCECNVGLIEDSLGNCVPPVNLCTGPHEVLLPSNECGCLPGYEDVDPDVVDADCRTRCLPGEIRDPSTLACIAIPTCGAGQTYNLVSNSCECNPPLIQHPSDPLACLPACPAGQHYDTNLNCVCPGNQVYNAGLSQCECPSHLPNWNAVTQLCSSSISCTDPNEVLNPSPPPNCVCQAGFFRDSFGDCVTTCPADQYYDINQLACVCLSTSSPPNPVTGCPALTLCTPGLNEMQDPYDPRVCICQAGFQRDGSGYCCLPDMHFSTTYFDCVCDETNQPADPLLGCSGTSCIPGLNEVACPGDSSQCCCATGFVRDSGGVCCPPGEQYNSVSGNCEVAPVCVAGINEIAGVADPDNPPSCICDPAFERNYAGSCVLAACNDPNERRCPGDFTRCCCLPGYTLDSYGDCVSICPSGQHYDSISGYCVCDTTLATPVLGTCPACVAGTNEQAGVPDLTDFVAPLRCECLPSHVRDGSGICQYVATACTPGPNEIVDPHDSTQCICDVGYERCHGNCVAECPSGHTRNPADCSCVPPPPTCTAGLNEQAGVPDPLAVPACMCLANHTRSNGVCCPNGQIYNLVTSSCEVPSCTQGLNEQAGVSDPIAYPSCACIVGYFRSNGVCCPAGTIYDTVDSRCECSPGFNEMQDALDPENCICLAGHVRDSNGFCCPSGQVYNSATMSCELPSCTQGLNEQAGVSDPYAFPACACIVGYIRSSGVCCPAGTTYDAADSRCECVPGINEQQDPTDPELCVCSTGFVRDAGGYCCPAGTVYDVSDARCECSPGINERQNPWNVEQCICVSGYVRDSNGYCCPSGQTYNTVSGSCESAPPICTQGINEQSGVADPVVSGACACIFGYVRDSNGICCPSGQTYDSNLGRCAPPPSCIQGINELAGFPDSSDSNDPPRCVCRSGHYRDANGICCPSGQNYNLTTMQCEPPPPLTCTLAYPWEPCEDDASQCCCADGYELTNGYCCPSGEVYDPIAGVCCPDGQFYDSNQSQCVVCIEGANEQGGVPDPNFPGACLCDPFYVRGTDGVCTPGVDPTEPILSCAPGDFPVLSGSPFCEEGEDLQCYFEGSTGSIAIFPDEVEILQNDCTWEDGTELGEGENIEDYVGDLCAVGNGPWQCDIQDDRYGGCDWGFLYSWFSGSCEANCPGGTYDSGTGNCEYCDVGYVYNVNSQQCEQF